MKTLYTTYNNFAKRLVMSLMVFMTVGVGSVFADAYTWTLASGDLGGQTSPASSVKKGSPAITWNTTYTWGTSSKYLGWDGNNTKKGVQIGSGSAYCTKAVFSTSDISGTITNITVNGSHASSGGASIVIKVGGETVKSSTNFTTTATDYSTGTISKSGQIEITISNSKEKAFYLKSISITYTPAPSGYTITYNTDGGTAVSSTTGTKLPNPLPTTTKTGYTFAGWYTNSAWTAAATAGATIDDDITLYAKWTAKTITITWNANNGTVSPATATYTYDGAAVELPTPTRTGYTFNGWFTASSGGTKITEVGTTNKPATNVTYYAQWTAKGLTNYRTSCTEPSTFTVTYNGNGNTSGSVPEDNTEYAKDAQVTVLDNTGNLAKTSYTFNGWNTKFDGTGTPYTAGKTFTITENTTLYAQWKAIPTYTVTFDSDGGSDVASQTIEEGNRATKPADPTKEGYDFVGWYNGNTEFEFDEVITGDITLTAKWNIITYNIEYTGLEGATHSNPVTYDVETATITFTAPSNRDGYVFKGWTPETIVKGSTGDKTVTATWAKVYTITWLANGQEFHKQENAEEGTALDLPDSEPDAATYACDDKVFVGWTANPISGNIDDEPADLFTTKTAKVEEAATTYYAVFATSGPGGGGTPEETTTLDFSDQGYSNGQVVTSLTQGDVTITLDKGSNSNDTKYYTTGTAVRVYGGGYFTVSVPNESTISKITLAFGDGDGTNTITANTGSYTSGTWTGSASSVTFSISGSSGHRRIKTVSVTFATTTQGGTSYSEYVTTCAVIPDPVWGGAEIDNATISVNCGETSPMNSAATISFSAATNNTLTYDITVTASNGFLVSTNKTDNSKYGESVTVSPVKTGTNAGTITQKVYVRAVAPAMSSDDFTGTITISGKQIETQTINVTADVTCKECTVQFVDRGANYQEPIHLFAGQTIDEAPIAPTGVCTDPIHYVFDGWAEAEVSSDATSYSKVSFPYEVTGNTEFYAVYRYTGDGGEPSNDFIKVTSAKDDWTGDYVIVNEDAEKAIGNAYQNTNTLKAVEVAIDDNKVLSPSDDIIWQIRKHGENYTMYNASASKYAYVSIDDSKGAGLSTTTANNTTQDIQILFNGGIAKVSGVDIYRSFYYYGSNTEWRTYSTGSYNTGALYCRSLETYLYTTSPICSAYVEITSDKDIYVTGGNAGGTHDLVVAQTKVAYQATRLEKDKSTGNLPTIKVLPSNITYDTDKTKAVTITFDEDSVRTLQSDGTYTISGTMTISYQPKAHNVTDDIQVVLNANYNPSADVSNASFTIHARSLPQEFVIVAKQGEKWYALNGDMSNGSSANPANGQITLDDNENPTKATYAPCNTIYTFDGLPNTGDRTRVRFQGTDGAWLWAASGTSTGIQNKSLKTTPSGNMEETKAYNWKLETEDNITYKFHNDNNSRLLGLSTEKFGMYASAVNDIRILPYDAKCLYNYAPSNLKVSVLKGTYVTLTWDAVAGATKYQYSNDGNTWTDAGTEPTVTINNLTAGTSYTYYIRAYHTDEGVSQECFDYSEVSFTTADCDDVPSNITYTADLNSITVSWTATASTATVKLYSDEAGATTLQTEIDATSPCKFVDLTKNTTYYVQIFSNGTCASPIIPVKTEDVEVDIVEWMPDSIIVDINTNEKIAVTLENEVSYGSGAGVEATELFFSKYYEATTNVKLVAIYNGTKNLIDLTDYQIHYGKDSWESQYITLKDFGATKGQIQPGEEIILYTMSDKDDSDRQIMSCVNGDYPDGKWVRVTQSNNDGKGHLSFAGDKTIVLKKAGKIIDIIGALDSSGKPTTANAKTKPSWGDANGWNCATGLSIADDTEIGISTNRCLLIRNNTVTSGKNAVTSNIDDFVTLCSEWKGAQVPDSDVDNGVAASCENFAYVGNFDYSDYYVQYESMGEEVVFEENQRNSDGTVTVEIPDLYKQSCRNICITLKDEGGKVISNREYKVPIMITTTQGTDGQTFIDLQQNLAIIETDGDGNVVATHPLSLEEVREICKTCDVVIRDNATLQKMSDDAANDHPQVRDIYVYENSSLVVPNGTNYTINNLSLRRKEDAVASVSAYPEALKLPESAAAPISLDFRLSAESWHWFTLPYNCNISEVTWVDGSPAQYNVDWFLMTYNGEKRAATQTGGNWKAYTGTTIKAGEGFILAINGNINNPKHTYELRFPMSKDVLVAEGTDKTVDVRAWGVETNIRPNHKGWNLVGNPYLAYYQRNNITNFEGLRLGQLVGPDSQTGYWTQTGDVPYVVVPIGAGYEAYEQRLASETDLLPFTAYFVQVGNDGKHASSDELSISFDHTKLQLSATPMPASIVHRAPSEVNETEEPVIVGVALTNSLGESDKTSLVIADQYTDEYEMNADFFKWFGDYYKYYTKPVLYTIGADQGKRAFNALNEQLATQPIQMGLFAAKAGDYTFALNRRSDLSKVEEVWLHDTNTNTYTNLMQNDYNFYTTKTDGGGRFTISVKLAPKVATGMENVNADKVWATTQNQQIIVNGLENNTQLWIYDAAGKLLYTEVTSNYQHRYSVPQVGTYFIALQKGTTKQTIKVVVE